MKRLTTIFFAALIATLAIPLISVEAHEYKGPERGKMGWGAAAYETKAGTVSGISAGGLRFEAAEPYKYTGPERGKMGWGAQVEQTREVKPAEK